MSRKHILKERDTHMPIQIIAGGSGSGKTTCVINEVIKKSIENPSGNYIVVVPEQYTMSTQKKLVESHPRKGILNIDVVSFERLAFKVFEEIGGENRPVLDDTGKNLIVRKVLEDSRKELQYFRSSINKVGFVSELKSVISELLQYDYSPEKFMAIGADIKDNNLLKSKISDIGLVYDRFKQYLHDNYITSEEILDVLCDLVEESERIRNSELVFDGFTGFTPIQYKLIRILAGCCKNITVTVTIDVGEKFNVMDGMENIFFMSKEMISKLSKINDEICREKHPKDIQIIEGDCKRFKSRQLAFLEKNIFRGGVNQYIYNSGEDKNHQDIRMFNARTVKDEITYAASEIIRLTRQEGYRYRDIAVVSGDMSTYGVLAGNVFAQNSIPVFVDAKKPVTDNPLIEMIRGVLDMIYKNYTYDTVFRYLRSNMTGIAREDIDILDNYCLAVGIHGSSSWHKPWTRKGRASNGFVLSDLNGLREKMLKTVIPLEEVLKSKDATVKDRVTALYEFLRSNNCQEKMSRMGEECDRKSEYEQIYKKVIELFDKMVELLGNQVVSLFEFNKILDSGFGEIKVGLIPPSSDCVVVGDIERTRLNDIKVLFLLGTNEGIIPKKSENRGVLSEADRDYLDSLNVELSADVRKKAFVQRFYMYLILTKASERLYVTFSNKGNDGASMLPSYIIRTIKQMFPGIITLKEGDVTDQLSFIRIPKSELVYEKDVFTGDLGEALALRLYGDTLYGSVSSFENFTGCMFSYYLNHGLLLKERDIYSFEVSDFGNVMHSLLEQICIDVKSKNQSISSLSDEERLKLVTNAIEKISTTYSDSILSDSNRNRFLVDRMTKLADKTLWAVGKQLSAGVFTPDGFEVPFEMEGRELALDKGFGRLIIKGKIDRIDICEDDENVYVRVIDYKSGKQEFNLLETYYGLKMQLITYLDAAMKIEEKRHPGKRIIPAGVYYYNIDDPIIEIAPQEAKKCNSKQDISDKILEKLKMAGFTNSNKNIVKMMDSTEDKSIVIPVAYNKDGGFKAYSKVYNTEQINNLVDYMELKSVDIGEAILDGKTDINPYRTGTDTACRFCPYRAVCGFSGDSNNRYRNIKKFDDEIIWDNIKKGVDENGKRMDKKSE